MGRPLIEVEGLRKKFAVKGGPLNVRTIGYVRALDGISFTIDESETFALVGESGCGKTTTARVILRLHTPEEGSVVVDGRDVLTLEGEDLRTFRMDVQAVFQDPWASLNPRMRVRTIIAEALKVNNRDLSRTEIREAVVALMERMGFSAWQADLYPHEFSGGQRQRVALAAALITNPKLVVLDEPVSALDLSVQAKVINLLKDLQEERNIAYLLIAHDLDTVRYVADRVGVMYLGQLVEEAGTDELFENPKHPYTQALLEARLPLHPRDRKEEIGVVGEIPSPIDPPSGCRFRTRCPFVMDACVEPPPTSEVGPNHTVSCYLYQDQ